MTAVYVPWAAELLLECAGAYLNFKRSKLLAVILTVCAISDIAAFLVFQFFSRPVYVWASWAQFSIKEVMLIWLACSICGMFVAEQNKTQARIAAAFLSLGSIAMVTAVSSSGETVKDRFLDGEMAANALLLGMVLLGWFGRRALLSRDWKWYAAGFLVMVGGDLAITGLWMVWDGARHLYPLPTIAAQIAWAFGPLLPAKLREFRVGLGQKITEAERVSVC